MTSKELNLELLKLLSEFDIISKNLDVVNYQIDHFDFQHDTESHFDDLGVQYTCYKSLLYKHSYGIACMVSQFRDRIIFLEGGFVDESK